MKSQALVYLPFKQLPSDFLEQGKLLFPNSAKLHPDRVLGFFSARYCLLLAYRELGLNLSLSDLVPMGTNRLPAFKEFSFSLSHTGHQGLTMAGAYLKKGPAVGLDLEWRARPIKAGSDHFFKRNEDQGEEDLLKLWCKKEAAFKSVSELFPPGLLLKDLWVEASRFGHHQSKTALGSIELKSIEHEGHELLVATAQRDS